MPVPNDLPQKAACKHIRKYCTEDDDKALAKYLSFYYCADSEYHDDDSEIPHHTHAIRVVRLVALLAWLTLLFSSVGIVACDFFCPNLSTLANRFGMSDSTAGVTLLSFGNSSPDVFSTYGAMRSGSGALAIGELIGAASFIVSIVAGSVMLIADFHVHPFPFCRDVGFFAVAVAVVLAFLVDGELHLGESLILVGLYVVYASIVIAGDWWQRRKGPRIELPGEEAPLYVSGEHRTASSEDPSQATNLRPSEGSEADDASLLAIAHSSGYPSPNGGTSPLQHKFRPGYLPRHSILGAIEFRDVLQNLRKEASSDRSVELFQSRDPDMFLPAHHPHALSRGHSLSSRPNLRLKTSRVASSGPMTHSGVVGDEPQDARRRSLSLSGTNDYFSQGHEADAATSDLDRNVWQDDTAAGKVARQHLTVVHERTVVRLAPRTPETTYVRARRNFFGFLKAVFPSLQNLWAKSWLGIFISFATAPTILLLNLTLPIVDAVLEAKIVEIETKADASVSLSLPGPENVLLAHGGQEPLHDQTAANGLQVEAVDDEESIEALIELSKARKILMPLQCLIATPFCVWALSDSGDPHLLLKVLIALAVGAGLAAMSIFVLWRARKRRPSVWMASIGVLARCVIGFLVAVLWIMTIVDQVILVLQALGSISGVSDAGELVVLKSRFETLLTHVFAFTVLGLTVFAAGNSLGDFVANTTMAPLHPVMAISACFAGPLLELLLGIGLSGTVLLSAPGRDTYEFDFSPTLLISGGGILLLLLGLLIAVPLQGFHLTRKTGICLASGYAAIMTINLIAVWAGFDTPM